MIACMSGKPAPEKLLHTKLMPPRLHSTVILRPGLLARLDEGLSRKLIYVGAPTGFGKTTLVRTWLAERKLPAAWVTLDENDNDPVRFWTYVITALRTFDHDTGKSALAMLSAPQPPHFQAFLTPLINDISRLAEAGILVLEDFHTISAKEINEGVAYLLSHLPEAVHIVLVSRSEPDLPLAFLRARDELVEISAANLRFNLQETEAFLRQSLATALPPALIATLQERTEGWPAGVRLATLALQAADNRQDAERIIQAFSGSHRYVADYMTKEVFEAQDETTQNFLLGTSFLSRLTGSLCDAVTGGAGGAAILERLERDHLFIVQLDHTGDQTWYRYNTLFAESIQHLARQRMGEAGVQAIFEKASAWYEYHQLYGEAIEAALSARLYDRAIRLIELYIEIHDVSEMRTLDRWLANIPIERILSNPEICLNYAQVTLYSYDRYSPATYARMEPLLRAAEEIWRNEGRLDRVGRVLALRGMASLWLGDFTKTFENARRSLEYLPEQDVFWRGVSLLNTGFEELNAGRISNAQNQILEARALMGAVQNIHGVLAAVQMLAEIFYHQGEMEQSALLSQQILEQAVGGEEMLDDQGIAWMNLANIAYEQNNLERAEQCAQKALELARRRANETLVVQASIRLAYTDNARGKLSQAQEILQSQIAKARNPSLLRDLQTTQAHLSILSNDTASLGWWLALISAEKQDGLHLQKEHEAFVLARLQIAEGRPGEALGTLQKWLPEAVEHGRLRSQVRALSLEALAQAKSDLSKAGQALTQALSIAQAKGLRRIIIDEGAAMASLLQATIPSLSRRPLVIYATSLLHAFSPEMASKQAAPVYTEPLSSQEQRVLRLLITGLSNPEIAQELVVSTNTVKSHVKSIYRKLNINSREEARQIAREMHLL